MSLSILLILFIPIFLIPCIFLPKNKLIIFSLSSGIPGTFFVLLFIFDLVFPSLNIKNSIGETFLGMFSFLTNRPILNHEQQIHLTFNFVCLFFYFILYLLIYMTSKFWFIGINPSVHKTLSIAKKVLLSLLFFSFSYVVFFIFMVEIREIIPLSDGFLSFFFNIIYNVGA